MAKSSDVAVVVSLMGVLLVGMIALVVIVGRSDDKKPVAPAPSSSVETAIASASPSHPIVLIVDPASTDPPIVASEIPAPPATQTPEPTTKPPSVPKFGMAEDPSSLPLNASDINAVVDSHRDELKAECYSKITNIKSSAKIVMHIAKEGNVTAVDLLQSAGPAEVGKCVADKAKTWVFPKSGNDANVQMPFFFR